MDANGLAVYLTYRTYIINVDYCHYLGGSLCITHEKEMNNMDNSSKSGLPGGFPPEVRLDSAAL